MRRFLALSGVIATIVMGCSLMRATPAALAPAISETPASIVPISEDWDVAAPGIWMRWMVVDEQYAFYEFDMLVVRVDPSQARLRVHYQPQIWYPLADWVALLPEALFIVNASFFTAEGHAIGLVITDGEIFGSSLRRYGGMLQVNDDRSASLRYLPEEPYQGEAFSQAVQGYPMLIQPGGQAARTGQGFDDPARRTAIGIDTHGHLYFFATVRGLMTLRNLQQWLLDSDLGLDAAFGLDGGKSSGVYLVSQNRPMIYPSIQPVPVVIAVYPD